MTEAGLWKIHPAKIEKVHQWRERRACFGELVQWDTSEHDWLEGRGEKLYLIKMIDDATSRLFCRFVRHDSTEENMRLLQSYLEQYGRPLAFYTDKAALFANTPKSKNGEMPREGETPPTQIGRALQELGIEWIPAHSPQAKGRVERSFGTDQDRLVKGLRIAGAATLEQANAYLENEYMPEWEARSRANLSKRPMRIARSISRIGWIRFSATSSSVLWPMTTQCVTEAERGRLRPPMSDRACGVRGYWWNSVGMERWPSVSAGAAYRSKLVPPSPRRSSLSVRLGGGRLFRQGRKPGCAASSWRKRHPSGPSSKPKLGMKSPNEGKKKAGQRRPGYLRVFLSRASARRLHPSNALAFYKTNPTARSWHVGILHRLLRSQLRRIGSGSPHRARPRRESLTH